MIKSSFLLAATQFVFTQAAPQSFPPQVASGKIERFENFKSNYVTSRNIDVWLPQGYSPDSAYAVLYMHDGQMLFDSTQTWNKLAWHVDAVVTALVKANQVKNVIVVGIWNGGETRHPDYFPQKPFFQLSRVEQDSISAQLQRAGRIKSRFKPNSDNYLRFLTKELKPFIDKRYPVQKGKAHTFIAGSSMGALISLYAICEYPKVFGGAGCLSTHWPGVFTVENNPIPNSLIRYLKKKLPNPDDHKLYFDCGDQTLDALYPPIQKKVDSLMQIKGYGNGNWITRYFPGDDHSEKSWNKRFQIPLLFLLKK